MARRDIRTRFNAKVRVDPNGCHTWTGAKNSGGYGQLRVGERRLQAHRLAYILAHQRIPKGVRVLHACHHRDCVNLDHLHLSSEG